MTANLFNLYARCTYRGRWGTKRVNFRLPSELVEKADVAAEVTHRNRTEVVRDALREYLETVEDEEGFREAVVELYLEGNVGFETLKEFVGRQDAEAVRSSKALLDEGRAVAEELAEQ